MRRACAESRGGSDRGGLLEHELVVPGVDPHRVALPEVALEQAHRQRVFDQPLQGALERAGAVGRVPARLGDDLLRLVGQLERQPAFGEPVTQAPELELDDLTDLLPTQRRRG